MKNIILLLLVTILVSCSYRAYIYDMDKDTPIKNVKIYDKDILVATTDKNGYFKLKEIKNLYGTLTLKKKKTIELVKYIQRPPVHMELREDV